MKRNIILGCILLLAICAGSVFMGKVGAQKSETKEPISDVVFSPDANTPQALPFSQNWTTTTLIATNDDWAGVPGVVGFLGNYDAASPTNVDPRTLLAPFATNDVDVIANATGPDGLASGGVAEFDAIPNPAIALNGSGTADAPHVVLYLNTTGQTNISFTCNVRDLDGSADDAAQQFNVQYRVGGTGSYVNVTNGFFADVTTAGTATQTTAVNVTLPADANNQAIVEIRLMTVNAVGNDEWIGIDDISVTGSGGGTPTPSPTPTATPSGTPARFLFTTRLSGAQEVPANASTGRGFGRVVLNAAENQITASVYWEGLGSGTTVGHIHTGAIGANGPVTFDLAPTAGQTRGSVIDKVFTITPAQVATLRAGGMYFNIHSTNFPGGEIRGQIVNTVRDAPLDFNGDSRTDFSVIRQTAAVGGTQARWYSLTNATPQVETQTDFGVSTDSITPGDFDGDGKDDLAIWRSQADNSTFFILQSSTNTLRTVRFGIPNDDPFVIGDYDGDGVDDPAIYRKGGADGTQSFFWWFGSFGVTKNVQVVVPWGVGSDSAIPGDYNGDGKSDFCAYRSISNRGLAFIHYGTGGFDAASPNDTVTRFGLPNDTFVPGDYDGDGRTDLAVTRIEGNNLAWYYLPSTNPTGPVNRLAWGRNGIDFEVQGDYDADGITDRAVYRSFTGQPSTFFVLRSSDQAVQYQNWGLFGDVPAALDTHNQ